MAQKGTSLNSISGSLIDQSGNLWTLRQASGLRVYCNGRPSSPAIPTALLYYDGDSVFQRSTSGQWFQFDNGQWTSSGDPIPATDRISVDFGNLTGVSIAPTSFGCTLTAESFAAITDSRFQDSVAMIGGLGLIRLSFDAVMLPALFSTRFQALSATPDWSSLDALCQGLAKLSYERLVVCLGSPAPWLKLDDPADRQIYATMAVAVADHLAHNNCPCHYWECLDTPELNDRLSLTEAADLAVTVSTALKAYDATYKVGGPGFAANPLYRSADLRTWTSIFPGDFISYRYFSFATPENNTADLTAIRYAISGTGAAGNVLTALGAMVGETPCLMNYNLDAVPSLDETRQMNHVGAVFQTAALCDAVASGLSMGAVWRGVDAETAFGLFDDEFQPRPPASVLGWLHSRLPGFIVQTARSNPVLKLALMATRSDHNVALCLVNYDDQPIAVGIDSKGYTWPAQIRYFEVSADANGLNKTISVKQLVNVVLPAMSVVVLSAV